MDCTLNLKNILIALSVSILAGFVVNRIENVVTRNKRKGSNVGKRTKKDIYKTYFASLIFVLYYSIILYRLMTTWPFSAFQSLLVLIGFFILPFVFYIIHYFVTLRFVNRIPSEVALLSFLVIVVIFADRLFPHQIYLKNPEFVSDVSILNGRVVRNDLEVYILIKPVQSTGTFIIKANGPDGNLEYNAVCHFGGADGSQYNIQAMAIPLNSNNEETPVSPEILERTADIKSRLFLVRKSD